MRNVKLGSRFYIGGVEYLLALVTYDEVALISLKDGNRWDNPVKIIKINSSLPLWTISWETFKQTIGSNDDEIEEIYNTIH